MPGTDNGITIISRAADGSQGNLDSGGTGGGNGGYDNSTSFSISADGTKVAFNSDASNLVPGDTNGYTDVFVKDLKTGAVVLASTLTGSDVGRSLQPAISPDGTKVAFATTPFVNGAPFGSPQIFIKDLVTGTVTLAVTDSQGAKLVRDIVASPVFSPDGTRLAFYTTADLTGVGTSRNGGLYIKDLGSRVATLVSAAAPGRPGNGRSDEAVFSPDGTKIAFISNSTNLGSTPKLGNSYDVYVKDLVTGAVTLVSADAAGQRQGTTYNTFVDSTNPAFSPDGREVAFQSTANNLVPGDQDNGSDIFIKDLTTGAISRVTTLADSTSEGGYGPAFSPDGTKIAFWTFAPGFSPYPHPGGSSIYIKDLVTGVFTLASPPADPAKQGIGNSQDPRFSPDGSALLFWSTNEALVATDANGNRADIFMKSLSAPPPAPPVAVADSYTTAQGTALAVASAAGLLANDTDPGGKPLTAVLVGNPAHGTLSLNADGSFTYTPAAAYHGSDAFTYKASDGPLQSVAATVSLTVTPVDHPVTANNDSYAVSNAVPSADFTTAAAAGVLANDVAPDGGLEALGIVVNGVAQTGLQRTAAGGYASVAPDGRLTYDQPFNTDAQGLIRFNGIDSFTYRARDSDGSTADATVALTVGGGVDHPVVAAADKYSVFTSFAGTDLTTGTGTGVLANDFSQDGGLVVLGIVVNGAVQTGFVRTAAGGQAKVSADGRLAYDQPFSSDAYGPIFYNGLDGFTYRVRDSDGSTADATVTLTVGEGVNHPVIATDDSYSVPPTNLATSASNGVLANDYSADMGLVALGIVVGGTVQTGLVRTAAGGQAEIFPDGRVTYAQPFSSDAFGLIRYVGLDSFIYRVRDSDGSTADATVTLSVGGGVNHPVVVTNDSYAVPDTFPSADFATDAATGVLANDYAADGGLVALGIVVNGAVQTGLVRTAAGGTAQVLPDGRLIYQQPFGTDAQGVVRYNGLDSLTYRVRDGDGSIADATVTLVVGTGGNRPPAAAADTLTVAAHAAVAGNLLANDSDPDAGDALALTAIRFAGGQPVAVAAGAAATLAGEHGTLTVGSDGRYSYAGSLAGTDPFSYTVSDGRGGVTGALLTATVSAGAPPPADQSFAFGFLQSTVSYVGRQALLTGPDGVTRDVTGIGHLHFTDGTIDEADGSPLVDDLFYDARSRDVYAEQVDPDTHYAAFGSREGRDPNALFSNAGYLAANPDVKAAGPNPLQHYDQNGWREGRDASPDFSSKAYLLLNPDVAVAGLDPLAHYLANGQAEGRVALPGTDAHGIAGAFDTSYYLAHNPDVRAAGVDPLLHFLTNGWQEGRDPDAYFSTSAYLAANPDVAEAGLDPLVHYEVYGWTEGRPTSGFNTQGYLAANTDVAAARIDPLQHFLQFGMVEGRHGWEV